VQYLKSQGMNPNLISAQGFGDTHLVAFQRHRAGSARRTAGSESRLAGSSPKLDRTAVTRATHDHNEEEGHTMSFAELSSNGGPG
jgi:hypothetical protein